MRTDVREHLAQLARDVTVTIPSTSEKGVTFTVIFLMDLSQLNSKLRHIRN
jgi:cell division protein ZapA (FtsZ GTPase activity inhibitor)